MRRRRLDRFQLLAEARGAAEELLLKVYRLDVAKALDPTDPDDFLVIRARLSSALKSAVSGAEGDAITEALQELDVNWPELSATQRDSVLAAAQSVLNDVPKVVLPAVDLTLGAAGERIVRSTKAQTIDDLNLKIRPDLSRVDQRVIDFVRNSQTLYVRDRYGERAEEFSDQAREIVADALEEGLGQEEIGERLNDALGGKSSAPLLGGYWDNIATIFANRARNFSALATMDQADIQSFKFVAVMDEVTSRICREMHGRVFSVEAGMSTFSDAAKSKDPASVQPFVSETTDEEGESRLTYKTPGGQRRAVSELSDDELEAAGISVPPLHGHCRSTIVAVEGSEAASSEE